MKLLKAPQYTLAPPAGAPAGSIASFFGNTPGLYGGTQQLSVCNAGQVISYLAANPAKAAAWAGAGDHPRPDSGVHRLVDRRGAAGRHPGDQPRLCKRPRQPDPGGPPGRNGGPGRQVRSAASSLLLREPVDPADRAERPPVHGTDLVGFKPGQVEAILPAPGRRPNSYWWRPPAAAQSFGPRGRMTAPIPRPRGASGRRPLAPTATLAGSTTVNALHELVARSDHPVGDPGQLLHADRGHHRSHADVDR